MLTESASSFVGFPSRKSQTDLFRSTKIRQKLGQQMLRSQFIPFQTLSQFELILSLSTLYLSFCFSSISLSIFLHFLSLCSPLYLSFMPSYLFLFCLSNTLLLSLTCSLSISFSQPTIYYLSYHNYSVLIISFIFRSTCCQ